MNRLLSLGLFTLIGFAATACGDDDDDTPGTSGSGGMGGSGMTAAPCSGCVELELPVEGDGRDLGFQFNFGGEPLDASAGSVTWRVQLLSDDANANWFMQTYAANGPPEDPGFAFNSYTNYTQLTAANFPSGMWVDVTHDLSSLGGAPAGDAGADAGGDAGPVDAGTVDAGVVADAGADASADAGPAPVLLSAFDAAYVRSVGIQIGAAAANTDSGTIRLLVDSVTFTGIDGAPMGTFDMTAEGLVANNYQNIAGVTDPTHHP